MSGHAITLYISENLHRALEKERQKLNLDSKPIVAARIIESYFKNSMPSEED